MLTPAQLRAHRFISSVRGAYKSEDVDSFFEEVLASYEQLFRENTDIVKKISLLAERVEDYKNDEDNIKTAILTAQRMADQITKDASEKARIQLNEAAQKLETVTIQANTQAQQIIDAAQNKAHEEVASAEARAAQVVGEADKQAQEILSSAHKESAEQLEKAKVQLEVERYTLEMLKKESAAFKEELIIKYNEHMNYINSLPGAVNDFWKQKKNEEAKSSGNEPAGNAYINYDPNTTEVPAPAALKQEEQIAEEITAEDIHIDEPKIDENFSENPIFDEFVAENGNVIENQETMPALNETQDSNFETQENDEENQYSSLYTLRQRAMDQQKELFGEEDSFSNGNIATGITADFSSLDDNDNTGIQTFAEEKGESYETYEQGINVKGDGDSEDNGFRMYLENYKGDESITQDTVFEEAVDKASLFETVEYEDDEDDEDDKGSSDESSQSLFKGFFKK